MMAKFTSSSEYPIQSGFQIFNLAQQILSLLSNFEPSYTLMTPVKQQDTVELEIMQQARMTLAKSPPGTTVGGW